MEHNNGKKVPLQLDWHRLLPTRDNEPPPTLIIEPSSDSLSQPSKLTASGLDQQSYVADNVERYNDRDLMDLLRRKKRTLETTGPKLADKGEKLRDFIKQYEDELACRKRRRLDKEVDENEKPRPAASSSIVGRSVGFRQENESSKAQPPSSFASSFSNQMKDVRKDAFKAIRSDGSRSKKDELIVLDEENELYNLEEIDEDNKLAECLKEARIYYPSSDDPESVEIRYTDMDCLAPGGYLTSPIMNFYIRYLQQQASLTDRSVTDYLFLNTYFYKKLKDADSCKQSDRDTFFVKFRRWWKGVNIFQKAYVLIPIHEDLHWSLAIICIPDKEDESGPIILHLDSLSLHSSRSVFDNLRRYLIEEWRYLDQESSCSDIPIADGIWKNLDCKIKERIITVPQQKNDYDCGLFVLYFIKRFIEEAPKRLKKQDTAMFGRQWFQPEEASDLRVRIRALLKIEFRKSHKENAISTDSVVTIHDS